MPALMPGLNQGTKPTTPPNHTKNPPKSNILPYASTSARVIACAAIDVTRVRFPADASYL
eukprot:464446-Amphidinium_carterae.1